MKASRAARTCPSLTLRATGSPCSIASTARVLVPRIVPIARESAACTPTDEVVRVGGGSGEQVVAGRPAQASWKRVFRSGSRPAARRRSLSRPSTVNAAESRRRGPACVAGPRARDEAFERHAGPRTARRRGAGRRSPRAAPRRGTISTNPSHRQRLERLPNGLRETPRSAAISSSRSRSPAVRTPAMMRRADVVATASRSGRCESPSIASFSIPCHAGT